MDHCQTFLNACRNGQKNIVRIFIERGGIDLDRRDAEGNTALHYVCREGFRDLAVLPGSRSLVDQQPGRDAPARRSPKGKP